MAEMTGPGLAFDQESVNSVFRSLQHHEWCVSVHKPDAPCNCGIQAVKGAVKALLRDRTEDMAARMAEAEELAVFDFLNWLTAQNIRLAGQSTFGPVYKPEGELWSRWKTERNL